MSFSAAQHEAVAHKLNTGLNNLSAKLNEVGPKANSAMDHWYITDKIADAIKWIGEKLLELGSWVLEKIKDLAQGIAAPFTFWFTALDWQDQVKAKASEVAGEIQPKVLKAPQEWKGDGADAYTAAVWPQPTAASQIGSLGSSVATALMVSAVAGLAFYCALAVILYKFITATIAAIVALGSAVFSWAGALLIIEEAGVNAAMIKGAVAGLLVCLGTQSEELVRVTGDAQDNTAFPDGHWPKGTA
jgi:hypothetical protein